MWSVVLYLRHLPPKGSLGSPKVYLEEEEHRGTEQHDVAPPGHEHLH